MTPLHFESIIIIYTTKLPKIKIWEVTMKEKKVYPFTSMISLRISGKLLKQIDEKAKAHKKSRSYIIKELLKNNTD